MKFLERPNGFLCRHQGGNGFCWPLLLASFALSASPSLAGWLDFWEPTNLTCRFTGGTFTNLGIKSDNQPKWTFDLRLDRSNKTVLFDTGSYSKQLVSALYGSNSVQFKIVNFGDKHTILLDLKRLNFQWTWGDEISVLNRKGVCRRS